MTTLRCWGIVLALTALSGCGEPEPLPHHVVSGGDAERGSRLISAYGCGSCHNIPGVGGATGVVGPPLDDWASRQWIAGNLWNEPANLIAWLEDPQAIEPGTAMPSQGVTPDEARHIAAYLYTLGGERPGPPHPFPLSWLRSLGHGKEKGSGE